MILGIDCGTTGTTAVLLNLKGKVLGRKTVSVRQYFPQAAWVEHSPPQIWKTVGEAVTGALRAAKISPKKIQCIGLTNQRETVSLFDGETPLHPFIVWQDRRTAAYCESLKKYEDKIIDIAGTPVDPYFSASKIRWLLKKLSIQSPSSRLRFRTVDSFVVFKMTGRDCIEATNASRVSLMDLKRIRWSEDLFDLYEIPRSLAPTIIPSQNLDLKTRGLSFLPDGIPISGILGDQQAALFGQSGWNPGAGKITFGTGSFILLNTGKTCVRSKNRLVSTLALQWRSGEARYALEGSAFICGAWIQWLRDELGLIKKSAEIAALARSAKTSDGVMVIPALSGLGAPFWKSHARGAILGLTRGSSKAQIARASLEALAFQNRALIDAMKKDAKISKEDWRVDGGAASNNLLMQIQADVLGKNIIRPKNLEATATGAAFLAAEASGLLSLKEIQQTWKPDRRFEPRSDVSTLENLYQAWHTKVLQSHP